MAYPRSSHLPPWSFNQTYMPHSSLIFRPWFETPADRWKAVWIGDGGDKPLYIRRSFELSRRPTRAIVFATGLGHFNFTVNGKAASDHVLDPGWTDYRRTVQFVSYDILASLAVGENVLGAHVGNGFYAGDQGDRFFWPLYEDNVYVRSGNELCFMCELHLFYEDGEREVITSDPDWQVSKSATTLANIYESETHDRRLYPVGWNSPGYDASAWTAAKPLTGPRGVLRYQSQPPVTLQDVMEPISSTIIRPGVMTYDLGQNSSIMVKIALQGNRGSKVTVRYAETVDDEGAVLMPDELFKEFETKVYSEIILAGTSEPEVWQPDFCFTSARYIQLDGMSTEEGSQQPRVVSVVGQHVSSAARRLGTMKTDKEDVNKLINACYWSFASNLFSYHTDCPQIEKFGWLEVTHLLFPATQYIRDIESLHSKILQDMMDAQEPSGFVPNMAPDTRFMHGPLRDTITWGCAICFVPLYIKQYYGSTRMIKKVYRAAVRYVEYISAKEHHGGLIEHGLGDWGLRPAYGNSQSNIETAVYYQCYRSLQVMAQELGFWEDAQRFERQAERIWDVYNKALLVLDDPHRSDIYYTSLDDPTQRDCTAVNQAVALQFGMVPSKYMSSVQKTFLDSVSDGKIVAGEIGLRYLFTTLSSLDRPDIVLQMARQEEHPSYMRFIRRGETTLSEFWQDNCRSKCHDMFGTIYEWFYLSVLGVQMIGEAYETFRICPPYKSEFDYVEGEVLCPNELIRVTFSRSTQKSVSVRLTVPFGSMASFRLPHDVQTVRVTRNGGEAEERSEREEMKLEQGSYEVSVETATQMELVSVA